ncbi:MAG TPA: sulfatase-like hydrolase/transferase [Acidimicrobiia bacterium]|jgi:hypothetical protein
MVGANEEDLLTDQGTPSAEDSNTARRTIGPALIALLVIAPAASPALTLWASNVGQVPKLHRLVLVAAGFALLGVVVFLLLRRTTSDSRVAAFVTFFALLTLTSGARVLENGSWLVRWVAALAAVAIAAMIVHRLRALWMLDAVIVASAVALIVPPLISGTWAALAPGADSSVQARASLPEMSELHDVVLVVVDGYTSLPVLRELYGFEDPTLRDDLRRAGLEVVEPIFSPYPMTHLTISSLLELDYVTEDRPRTSTEDGRSLGDVIGGDSFLTELLDANGYRITMVEPGWHVSTCGARIDVCVADRFVDESVGAVISQSMLWSVIQPSVGSAFSHGARNAMNWTAEHLDEVVNNGSPDFVFVHVLAPHPPNFLDAECAITLDSRSGASSSSMVGRAATQAELDGYVNQVRCVNRFLRDVAAAVSASDALVFIVGDHGSDSMSQLDTDPTLWTDPQVVERMSVFLTAKPSPGCELERHLVTLGMLRSLVSCAGGLGLSPLQERAFLLSVSGNDPQGSMRSLDTDELRRFANCLETLGEDLACP